jgi:hypothetical protein
MTSQIVESDPLAFAVWLIVKGFNSSAIAYPSGQADIDQIE